MGCGIQARNQNLIKNNNDSTIIPGNPQKKQEIATMTPLFQSS